MGPVLPTDTDRPTVRWVVLPEEAADNESYLRSSNVHSSLTRPTHYTILPLLSTNQSST